jgi:uncharacterized protein
MEQYPIQHDPAQREFFTLINGDKAYLAYCMLDARTADFYRTFVPDEHRGSGIARALVDAGLGYAATQGWRVVPSCWYVAMIEKRRARAQRADER